MILRVILDVVLYVNVCYILVFVMMFKRYRWFKLLKNFRKINSKAKQSYYVVFFLAHLLYVATSALIVYVWILVLGEIFIKLYVIEYFLIYYLFYYLLFNYIILNMLLSRYRQQNALMSIAAFKKPNLLKVRRDLLTLKQTVGIFNDIFGWNFLFNIFFIVTRTLIYLDMVLKRLFHHFDDQGTVWSVLHFVSNMLMMAIFWVGFTGVAFTCDSILKEYNSILAASHKMVPSTKWHLHKNDEIHAFVSSISNYRPNFTAARFFSIDRSTVFSVLNSVSTFLIVIIQF
ncbi:7tm 7 domain containing protein, partial [Asbolus verrucosus]